MKIFSRQTGRRIKEPETPKKTVKTMDVILAIVGVALLVFTIAMIHLFTLYGSVPDTLVTCVFAALGGECGVMGWIKTTKERNRERKWQEEDRQTAAREAAQAAEEHPRNDL